MSQEMWCWLQCSKPRESSQSSVAIEERHIRSGAPCPGPGDGQIYVGGCAPGSEFPRFIIARVAPRVANPIVALPLVALAIRVAVLGIAHPVVAGASAAIPVSCSAWRCNRKAARCTSKSCSAGYRRSSGRMRSEHTPPEWRSAPQCRRSQWQDSAVVTLPVYRPLSET